MILMIILALFLAFLGWGVEKKKWYFLISGYNMMSPEEQAAVDVKRLAKSIALMCYILAVLMLILGICVELNTEVGVWIVIALMVIVPFVIMFRSKQYTAVKQGKLNAKSKKITLLITIATIIFVGAVIYTSSKPMNITVSEDSLHISGAYGNTIDWSEIKDVEFLTSLPEISMRTNGSAVGSKLKGNFKLTTDEKVKLFVDKKVDAYISFIWDDERYIINDLSVEKTEALYKEFQKHIQ